MTLFGSLQRDEGFSSTPFRDTEEHWTIGYGFNLETVKLPRPVADLWLSFLINDVQKELCDYEWYNGLDNMRKDVIVNMAYNLGLGGILKFEKMIAAIEEKNYPQAAAEMLDSKWANQVGQRAVRLSELMAGLT